MCDLEGVLIFWADAIEGKLILKCMSFFKEIMEVVWIRLIVIRSHFAAMDEVGQAVKKEHYEAIPQISNKQFF